MRNPPEAERLQAYLRALRQPCTVLVSASHASFFKPAPRDAHAYIVQDPARPWVHHWTRRDGTHVVLDKKQSQRCPGFSGKVAVHIKDLTGKAKKKAPRYSTLLTVGVPIEREPEDPPAIRLIGIERVMAIVGFQKSFIYAQPDFPEPVRLGPSRRSAVRWVEAEVLAWCEKLISRRSTAAKRVPSLSQL
uniref:helix-turn-helix transcriptional regulator n=1 Tax=uncultured Acidovorax sp. TaxID=158751 RepID=UPI0030F5D632